MKMNLKKYLEDAILKAIDHLGYVANGAFVTYSNRPDLSDYQSNVSMPLAKSEKKSPIAIANEICEILKCDSNFASVRVDGPGFINVKFSDSVLEQPEKFQEFSHKTVVIDYGGPNIAKEMHVGHLRSAIIGESVKRILKFCGDKVIGDIHFGDWGTPIGMLITQLQIEHSEVFDTGFDSFDMNISEISALYRRASKTFKEDAEFKEKARIATFELQNGKQSYRAAWQFFRDRSVEAVKQNYDKLDVSFDLWLGESDANDFLPKIVEDLLGRKLAIHSEGAVIVPMQSEDGEEKAPLILRKSDGGYTYAITDLGTIIQRQKDFHPDAILYVVDARQQEHFDQVFKVARLAGYVKPETALEFIPFGTVNGKDGKPFKTREGNVMNLKDLIDLAEDKAREKSAENDANNDDQIQQIAIGALKFQDLKNVRTSNYIFDTENFTKSEGKTGVYIQYTVARINSVIAKSKETDLEGVNVKIFHLMERDILLQLNRLSDAIGLAYTNREPSVICDYIYLLAQKFNNMYSELPIKNENDDSVRKSRLKLCLQVKNALGLGLYLLGIKAPARISNKVA